MPSQPCLSHAGPAIAAFKIDMDQYLYEVLPVPATFGIAELLPGKPSDPVSYLLHQAQLSDLRHYEAISYAWGHATARAPVIVHGKWIEVTKNLHAGLRHLREDIRGCFSVN